MPRRKTLYITWDHKTLELKRSWSSVRMSKGEFIIASWLSWCLCGDSGQLNSILFDKDFGAKDGVGAIKYLETWYDAFSI